MSNLKLDIIYYKTASDFEMEFNLSGCCRMRIFKDNIDTPRGLVNTLARDVARSQVILIVTDLTGPDSGIPIISKAIGMALTSPDKEEFGILTADPVSIPESSVPLVTKSGIFGGCIIECGPQSIIILSSVRSLRHEVLKAYVHNYIFDIGQLHAYNERVSKNNAVTLPPTIGKPSRDAQSEKANTDAEEPSNENPESATEEYNPNLLITNIATESIDEIEPGSPASGPKQKKTSKGRATNILLLIFIILLLLGFGVLAYFFVYLPLIGEPGVFANGTDNFITDILNIFTE